VETAQARYLRWRRDRVEQKLLYHESENYRYDSEKDTGDSN